MATRSPAKPQKRKTSAKPASSAARVRAYRANKRAQGLRLMQRWVPDLRSPKVQAELRRQARNLAKAPDNEEVLRLLDALYEDWE